MYIVLRVTSGHRDQFETLTNLFSSNVLKKKRKKESSSGLVDRVSASEMVNSTSILGQGKSKSFGIYGDLV